MATTVLKDRNRAKGSTRIPPPQCSLYAGSDPDPKVEIPSPETQCSPYPGSDPDPDVEILPPESGAGRSTNRARGPPLSTKSTRLGESLVSKRELARFLGISVSGLNKLIAKGVVPPHVLVGRLLKWHPADVRAWADRQQREVRLQHGP
jgi:predicted DNA-binding transcriptional regulator AlpA